MIQQMQAQCGDCNGEGSIILEKDKCKQCKGAKTVKEKKTLEVCFWFVLLLLCLILASFAR